MFGRGDAGQHHTPHKIGNAFIMWERFTVAASTQACWCGLRRWQLKREINKIQVFLYVFALPSYIWKSSRSEAQRSSSISIPDEFLLEAYCVRGPRRRDFARGILK